MFVKKMLKATLLAVFLLSLGACSDDDKDVIGERPVIKWVTPESHATFARGEKINVQFEVEAENGISSYKLDIHWGGSHTHSGVARETPETKPENTWSYSPVFTDHKGEKKAIIEIATDQIPADVQIGEYHLGVHVIDLSKKETQHYIEIEIVE